MIVKGLSWKVCMWITRVIYSLLILLATLPWHCMVIFVTKERLRKVPNATTNVCKHALKSFMRYWLRLSKDQFEVSLSMLFLLKDTRLINRSIGLMVTSATHSLLYATLAYFTYTQQWNVIIVLNVLGDKIFTRGIDWIVGVAIRDL